MAPKPGNDGKDPTRRTKSSRNTARYSSKLSTKAKAGGALLKTHVKYPAIQKTRVKYSGWLPTAEDLDRLERHWRKSYEEGKKAGDEIGSWSRVL